jgi:DNA-directed RNA polymerase specialized sigma24 family protein
MATAKVLNESYQNFLENPSRDAMNTLLLVIQDHCLSKYDEFVNADDLTQNVLIEIWRRVDATCPEPLQPFDPARSSFSTWTSLIVKTQMLMGIREEESEDYDSVGDTYDLDRIVYGSHDTRYED